MAIGIGWSGGPAKNPYDKLTQRGNTSGPVVPDNSPAGLSARYGNAPETHEQLAAINGWNPQPQGPKLNNWGLPEGQPIPGSQVGGPAPAPAGGGFVNGAGQPMPSAPTSQGGGGNPYEALINKAWDLQSGIAQGQVKDMWSSSMADRGMIPAAAAAQDAFGRAQAPVMQQLAAGRAGALADAQGRWGQEQMQQQQFAASQATQQREEAFRQQQLAFQQQQAGQDNAWRQQQFAAQQTAQQQQQAWQQTQQTWQTEDRTRQQQQALQAPQNAYSGLTNPAAQAPNQGGADAARALIMGGGGGLTDLASIHSNANGGVQPAGLAGQPGMGGDVGVGGAGGSGGFGESPKGWNELSGRTDDPNRRTFDPTVRGNDHTPLTGGALPPNPYARLTSGAGGSVTAGVQQAGQTPAAKPGGTLPSYTTPTWKPR